MTGSDRLRAVIARDLGLAADDQGRREAIAAIAARRGDAWIERLEAIADPIELRALATTLTVGETYFFRNAEQLRAMIDHAIRRASGGSLRVLSLGCSSGEEPYSIVMCARQAGVDLRVRGFEINADALARARRGRYSAWALRETPAEARARWFRRDGAELVLDRSVRDAVTLEERNLAAPVELPACDVVFCRNVLMYFTPAAARAVIARIVRALAPGGLLFLGHAETLRGLSDDFALRHTHDAFYYQREDGAPAAPGDAWFDSIQDSAARVRELAARHPPPSAPLAAADVPTAGAHYLVALRCEGDGDLPGAIEHDRAAVAIDPSFAMARLHLGLLARRAGDADGARRELAEAARLLADEDAARLEHFAGGFAREALIALCGEPVRRIG